LSSIGEVLSLSMIPFGHLNDNKNLSQGCINFGPARPSPEVRRNVITYLWRTLGVGATFQTVSPHSPVSIFPASRHPLPRASPARSRSSAAWSSKPYHQVLIFVLAEGLCALGDTGKECFRGAWLVSEGCILCSRQSFCEVGYC
jgi:hypothetical protein